MLYHFQYLIVNQLTVLGNTIIIFCMFIAYIACMFITSFHGIDQSNCVAVSVVHAYIRWWESEKCAGAFIYYCTEKLTYIVMVVVTIILTTEVIHIE